MAYHFGKLGYMAIQRQTTAGTPDTFSGASGEIGLPISDAPDLKPTIDKEYPNFYKRSSAEASDFIIKNLGAEGNIKVDAFYNGPLEACMFGIFGNVASTQIASSTAYTNVFTMVPNTPIWTVAVGADALNYMRYYDIYMDKMSLEMKPGENVQLSTSIQGKGGDITQSAFTPSYGTNRAFHFDDIGATLGGSANCDIVEMTMDIDRGLKATRSMCAAAPKGNNIFYTTTISVEGSMTMMFQDYTEYSYWLGGSGATAPTYDQTAATSSRALVLDATGPAIGSGNSEFKLELPKINYATAEIDMPFDDRMMVKFDFKGLYDATTEGTLAGTGVIKGTVKSDFNAQTVLV